jgi:hypothetical protein
MADTILPKIKSFNLTILFKYKSSSIYEFIETEEINFEDSMVLNVYSLFYGNGAIIFNISFEKGDVNDYVHNPCRNDLIKGSTEDCDTDQFFNPNGEQNGIVTLPRPVSNVNNIYIKYKRIDDENNVHSFKIDNPSKPIVLHVDQNNSFVIKTVNDN